MLGLGVKKEKKQNIAFLGVRVRCAWEERSLSSHGLRDRTKTTSGLEVCKGQEASLSHLKRLRFSR